MLLRYANLKRFDTPVEFRALEEDRALVLIRGPLRGRPVGLTAQTGWLGSKRR
jgi:hypothetical protein